MTALASEVLASIDLGAPPVSEVLRHLGYPAGASPGAGIAARIEAVGAEAASALRPSGAYAIHPVSRQTARQIAVAGVTLRGDVARFLGSVDRLAVVVATAGPAVSALSQRYAAEGDTLSAWIADATGSWGAEAAADAVTERATADIGAGEAATLRYSPGYCGMSIREQQALFGLVDAAAAGIELLPSMLMQPLKSVSGIVGIGSADALAAQPVSPCEVCGRVGCHMRR